MVISKNCNIKVVLSNKFHRKINWLVKNWDVEIGGFITGNWDNSGIYVDDLLIFKQKVRSTNVTKLGIADILLLNEVGVEVTNKIIGEWHSHNIMNTFWSSTDEEFIKSHLTNKNGEIIKNSMLSIVSAYHKNYTEEYDHKVRIDIKGFKGMNATFDDLEFSVEETKNEEISKIFSSREKIIRSAEKRVKPLKDKINEILKKTQEKIKVLKDNVEIIEEKEEKALSDFLNSEIKKKVERQDIVFNNSKGFQQKLSDIDKVKLNDNKNKQIEDKYLNCRKNKSIIVEKVDEWFSNSIIYFIEEEEEFSNLDVTDNEYDGAFVNGYNEETDNFDNYDRVNKSLDDEIRDGKYDDYIGYGRNIYD